MITVHARSQSSALSVMSSYLSAAAAEQQFLMFTSLHTNVRTYTTPEHTVYMTFIGS